jgi:hypothetical protein
MRAASHRAAAATTATGSIVAYTRGGTTGQASRRAGQHPRQPAQKTEDPPGERPSGPGRQGRRPAELLDALAHLYESAGARPVRALTQRSGRSGEGFVLPPTIAWRMTTRIPASRRLPRSFRHYEAFLHACGVTEKAMPVWRSAWRRVTAPSLMEATSIPLLRSRLPAEVLARRPVEISTQWGQVLFRLTAQELETVFTVGTAYLAVKQAQHSGTASPKAFERRFRATRDLLGVTGGRLTGQNTPRHHSDGQEDSPPAPGPPRPSSHRRE